MAVILLRFVSSYTIHSARGVNAIIQINFITMYNNHVKMYLKF